MQILRWILFSGLLAHKLVWESLKRKYRSPYVAMKPEKFTLKRAIKFIKVVILVFILYQTLFLKIFPISENPVTLQTIGTAIYFLGLTTAITARLNMGRNWVDLEDYQVLQEQSLVTSGIYRLIRHPIYI